MHKKDLTSKAISFRAWCIAIDCINIIKSGERFDAIHMCENLGRCEKALKRVSIDSEFMETNAYKNLSAATLKLNSLLYK